MSFPSLLLQKRRTALYRSRCFPVAVCVSLVAGCGDVGKKNGHTEPRGNDYPLAIGNLWTYEETDLAGNVLKTVTKEIVRREVFKNQNTFVQLTRDTLSRTDTESYLWDNGTQVQRLRQDQLTTGTQTVESRREYEPGFLRLDRSLDAVGKTLQESHLRREFDRNGNEIDTATRDYTWIVESISEEIQVPTGTFSCLKMKRLDENGEEKLYWFAADVGKVKEQGAEIEQLVEYTVQ